MKSRVRRREEARLVAELPEALERMAAGLRAGGTVVAGLEAWASRRGPLAGDAGQVLGWMASGVTLEQSLHRWRKQRPLPQVTVTAAALLVAVTAGGRSASALEGLAAGLRDAAAGRAEVRAQSAQARLSALVIAVAPAGAVALTAVVDPRVPAALVGTSAGRACLGGGLGLMAGAALWMARILRLSDDPPAGGRWARISGAAR